MKTRNQPFKNIKLTESYFIAKYSFFMDGIPVEYQVLHPKIQLLQWLVSFQDTVPTEEQYNEWLAKNPIIKKQK